MHMHTSVHPVNTDPPNAQWDNPEYISNGRFSFHLPSADSSVSKNDENSVFICRYPRLDALDKFELHAGNHLIG